MPTKLAGLQRSALFLLAALTLLLFLAAQAHLLRRGQTALAVADGEGRDGRWASAPARLDGDPETVWVTEHYDDPNVTALKDGVGVYVETEEPVAPSQMRVRSATEGWTGAVYAAADGPPEDIEGWGEPVGGIEGASAEDAIDLSLDQPQTFFLLWFTELGESSEQTGRYRGEVAEIELVE